MATQSQSSECQQQLSSVWSRLCRPFVVHEHDGGVRCGKCDRRCRTLEFLHMHMSSKHPEIGDAGMAGKPQWTYKCKQCERELPPTHFTKSQKRKRGKSNRTCTTCTASIQASSEYVDPSSSSTTEIFQGLDISSWSGRDI